MQIEVTGKEAREIYSQRYLDGKGKVMRYLPSVIFSVALIASLSIMYFVHDWLGVGAFIVLSAPSIFLTLKVARASGKYARDQIWEHHPEEILEQSLIEEVKGK